MTFRVGQKVEQIAEWGSFHNPYSDVVFSHTGVIYTIRDIVDVKGRGVGLRFFELRNPEHAYRGHGIIEQPFPAGNFRPIVERKTDIAFAHEILRKVSRKDRVKASADQVHRAKRSVTTGVRTGELAG